MDGEYAIKFVLGGVRPAGSAPVTIALWVDDRQVDSTIFDLEGSARFDLDRQDFGGQAREFRVRLTAGDRRIAVAIPRIFEGLPAQLQRAQPVDTSGAAARSSSRRPTRRRIASSRLRKRFEDTQAELQKIPLNGVRIGTVDVGGPYTQVIRSLARQPREDLHVRPPGRRTTRRVRARQIMNDLARRAFRRPSPPAEIEKYVDLVQQAQEEEESFDEGLAVGIQALLVSPDFLFRIERDQRGAAAGVTLQPITPARAGDAAVVLPVGQHAGRGSCGARPTPARCAIRRCWPRRCGGCCATRRSHALAENFGGQWLQFRALESVTRDKDALPGLRGLPAAVDAARDGAVRRARDPRRSQHPRFRRRQVLVPQRAAGAALRHPERGRARNSAAST